jgi:hypothetical protein
MNEAQPAEWQEFEPFKTLYVIVMDFRAKVTAAIFLSTPLHDPGKKLAKK